MASLTLPVRWYSNGTQHGDLELELERTAFMIVDSDCGTGNRYVEDGIAPALAAARTAGMRVVFIHNDFPSLMNRAASNGRSTAHAGAIPLLKQGNHLPQGHPINRIIPRRFSRCRMSQTFPSASGRDSMKRMSITICDVTTSRIWSQLGSASVPVYTKPSPAQSSTIIGSSCCAMARIPPSIPIQSIQTYQREAGCGRLCCVTLNILSDIPRPHQNLPQRVSACIPIHRGRFEFQCNWSVENLTHACAINRPT